MERFSSSDRLPPATPLEPASAIDRSTVPTGIRRLLFEPQSPDDLAEIVNGLKALGIDPAPEQSAFIRYYPPLLELPVVRGPVTVDLSGVQGSLALFLYMPFCTGRCSYCFYPKQIGASEETVEDYLALLRREIGLFAPTIPSNVTSIYVGGGTPSYLTAAQMERFFGNLDIPRGEATSMTCEVSPETLTAEKISSLRRCGVTRISMGVQSLDDGVLKATGRRYDARQAAEKIRLLAAGIPRYNIDFIYGLPGQGSGDVDAMLRLVREAQPPSVTFYQRWAGMRDRFSSSPRAGTIGSIGDMLSARARIDAAMAADGYGRDSLFRYVKGQGDGCQYCRTVWEDQSCVAAGLSAYSYVEGAASQNTFSLREYQESVQSGCAPIHRAKRLTPEEQATRALVLGLKTAGSICALNIGAIERKYAVSCTAEVTKLLTALDGLGMFQVHQGTVGFSDVGSAFSEQILGKIMEQVRFTRAG